MKTSRCLLTCLLMCILPAATISAQCTGAITPTLITYDSTVVGVGRAPYTFTFPKFNPTLGTLLSIRVQSVVSIQYSFTLENLDYSPKTLRHRFFRYDDITSPAVSFVHNGEYTSPNYNFNMVPGNDGVPDSGPDLIYAGPLSVITADTLVNRTLYNVANFMGPGNVVFNYATDGDINLTSGTAYEASTTDVIKFNISYVYCSAAALASNHINLKADNAGPQSAMVKWTTTNESQAASYELMVSTDGRNFNTATTIKAKGNFPNDLGSYQYKYESAVPVKRLYFRVKQSGLDNKLLLSSVKTVNWQTLPGNGHFVADPGGSYIVSDLPISGGTNWNVSIYSSNGQLIQADEVRSGSNATVMMKHRLQTGIYIIRAMNNTTREQFTQKILIP